MARFYGTVQGNRGKASRLGHDTLDVTAQSYSGDICVTFSAGGDTGNEEDDYVCIAVRDHSRITPRKLLYYGPVKDLLTNEGNHAIVRQFAREQLEQEYEGA